MLTLLLLLVIADTPQERPRHPLAPSLPILTKEELARYEKIVERFIEADTGKIKGPAADKAMAELNRLGPDAIFVLIDGFNSAANLEASCPAVILGKKIANILNASVDLELLTFAKENIGAGVTARRHQGTVKDLQLGCVLRKSFVQRQASFAARAPSLTFPLNAPASMSTADLTKAAQKAKGPQFKMLVAEAEKRQSPQLMKLLAAGAASADAETRKLGQSLLVKQLERQNPDQLKTLLKDESPELRAAAARAIGNKNLALASELIELLRDLEPAVQQAARQSLVRLAKGVDYGPEPSADSAAREAAIERWRQALEKQ
jgi:hypothetical protein